MRSAGVAVAFVLTAASRVAAATPAILVLQGEGSPRDEAHFTGLKRELEASSAREVAHGRKAGICTAALASDAVAYAVPPRSFLGVVCIQGDDLLVYGVVERAAYPRGSVHAEASPGRDLLQAYVQVAEMLREPEIAPSPVSVSPPASTPPEGKASQASFDALVREEATALHARHPDGADERAKERELAPLDRFAVGGRLGIGAAVSTGFTNFGTAISLTVRLPSRFQFEAFAILPFEVGAERAYVSWSGPAAYSRPLARFFGTRVLYHTIGEGRWRLPVGIEGGMVHFSPNPERSLGGFTAVEEVSASLPTLGAHAGLTFRAFATVDLGAELAIGSALGSMRFMQSLGGAGAQNADGVGAYVASCLSLGIETP